MPSAASGNYVAVEGLVEVNVTPKNHTGHVHVFVSMPGEVVQQVSK